MRRLEISDTDVMSVAIRQEIERNNESRRRTLAQVASTVSSWRAPCKGGAFPVGANPTRRTLQPEAHHGPASLNRCGGQMAKELGVTRSAHAIKGSSTLDFSSRGNSGSFLTLGRDTVRRGDALSNPRLRHRQSPERNDRHNRLPLQRVMTMIPRSAQRGRLNSNRAPWPTRSPKPGMPSITPRSPVQPFKKSEAPVVDSTSGKRSITIFGKWIVPFASCHCAPSMPHRHRPCS